MSRLPKATETQCTLYQNPIAHCTELGETLLKFVWNHNRSPSATTILRKSSKDGRITLLDFKLYYKAIDIKTD